MPTEIGRELKVSELRPRTIVVVGRDLLAPRCGPGLEQVGDDDVGIFKLYEYLGKP